MRRFLAISALLFSISGLPTLAADVSDFLGTFTGTAKISSDGSEADRDMSVTISDAKGGFTLSWTSIIHKTDGRVKENKYTITFTPSQRDGIFASAMKTNVFGKAVPLDPLKGDPYVWFNGAKRIVCDVDFGQCCCAEERRLSNIRFANKANSHRHHAR